ncbi:MAG: chromophore lyase CpcT/CpeT [Parasphingorhabdus sp.]|uniref:chromophore lyase CpcT/CpeT n=1 Tax=Parasphingorhabdus sp. TaxID=2709688 RepID=UPI0032978852
MKNRFYMALMLGFASIAYPASAGPMERDLLLLTQWFEGQFDNEEQRWFQNGPYAKIPEPEQHVRLHVFHKKLSMPALGKHVFYVEEYQNNDPQDIIRQRIVIFTTDGKSQTIRMQQGFFKNAEAVRGAHINPSKVESLTADDVFFLDECDVTWKRVASQFEGGMKPKSCIFGTGKDRRYSVHDMWLSPDKYWRIDSTFRVSDNSLFAGKPIDKPYQLRRAKPFNCQFYFFADNGFDAQVVENLEMHSQGGTVTATRNVDGKTFEILMRDKEYPSYKTRPDFLYFSLREQGQKRSLAFTVNDPDSRQIGVRAHSIGAFCQRKGFNFREPLELLEN